jgi:hypothetical protein
LVGMSNKSIAAEAAPTESSKASRLKPLLQKAQRHRG